MSDGRKRKSKLPAIKDNVEARDRVLRIGPDALEAIRYYLDPLLPTYGNKTASATEAGCSVSTFQREDVKDEIARQLADRERSATQVKDFLAQASPEAAHELVRQLGMGLEMELLDPKPLLDDRDLVRELMDEFRDDYPEDHNLLLAVVKKVVATRVDRAEVIAKNNKNVLTANRERRAALELLLKWHLGSPVQKRIVEKELPDEFDLSKLSDVELRQVRSIIDEVQDSRSPGPQVAEVVDEVTD